MIDWKNLLERAAWTFVEAFLVALPATISMDMTGAAWKSALLSAACAGISAVKTLLIDIIHSKKPPAE
jgi:hypothetical protein